ncbi:MAG TPA: hypothetical protein VII03_03965, partial [Solirubrobacteraceae bacterium]
MYASDHRTPWPRITGVLLVAGAAAHVLPVLAGSRPVRFPRSPEPISPALRRALGVEDRTAGGEGYAL